MIYDHILITDSTSEPTNELEFFTEELSVYHIPVNESPQQPPKKKVKHVPQILNNSCIHVPKKLICFWCFIFKQKIQVFIIFLKLDICYGLTACLHAHSEIDTCRCTRSN